MKKNLIRILSLVLVLLMILPFAVACKKDKEPEGTGDNVDETIDYQAILGFGPEDNGGRNFKMLVSSSDAEEHHAKELNSNFVNDAVFKRNIAVQDFFKITLETQIEPGDWADRNHFIEKVTTPIMSGDNEHDLIIGVSAIVGDILGNEYFLPVNQIDYIDLSKEWWVEGQYDNLQVNGNLFAVYGDMNLSLYSELHCFIFNAQMISFNSLKSPYAMVANNEWLYSNVVEQTVVVGSGDGDNIVEIEEDTFGMIGATNPQRALLTGFNLEILGRNQSTGRPEFPAALTQNYINAYNMVSDAFTSNEYNLAQTADASGYSKHLTAMAQDRCLYLPAYVKWITDPILTGMAGDFGVVPYPKLSAEQTGYYSQIATGATCTLFPKSLTDTDLPAKVATYMSYVGKSMVAEPYFQNYLKERLARSPEMQEMLETVRQTATMNLSTIYHTYFSPQLLTLFGSEQLNAGKQDYRAGIADEYASRLPGYKGALKVLLKKYK